MGPTPRTTLDYQTYRAGPDRIGHRTRNPFTIDSIGHGVFVNIERVQGF
jgi:hypothetical protein